MKPSIGLFNAERHEYTIDGRRVPYVTQVLADLVPGWRASDWFMQRGRAVHACAALIAQGKEFTADERIKGQVSACRKFFAHIQPKVKGIEVQVYSSKLQYAGTADLIAKIPGRFVVADYKATLTETVPLQCAAYAIAYEEQGGERVSYGMGVELHENGTYRLSDIYDLRRYKSEWVAMLTTYRVRERLGCLTQEKDNGE